jgi:RNA polymerase sigma-70 factor (ECF subfamily)
VLRLVLWLCHEPSTFFGPDWAFLEDQIQMSHCFDGSRLTKQMPSCSQAGRGRLLTTSIRSQAGIRVVSRLSGPRARDASLSTSNSSAILASHFDMQEEKGDVTLLLERLSAGDHSAEDLLMPRVYAELHRLAALSLRSERPGHTLQATALVHEAYMVLCGQTIDWRDRMHFFRLSAKLMRRILIDYARKRGAVKRGDGRRQVELSDGVLVSEDHLATALEVDDLLNQLSKVSQRQAQVVEMKFFAGLGETEIASILNVHPRTVKRDWFMARAWLHQHLRNQ